MRRSWMVAAASVAVLAVAPFIATTTAGATTQATERTVVRPVTASGHAVAGYSVKSYSDDSPIDCSYKQSSNAAVNNDINFCAPDAAYAVACWRASEAHHVLCLDNARTEKLVKFATSGKIAHTKAPKDRGPLDLLLTNGTFCSIRDGGAGATLRQHHSWVATYYCTGGRSVWSPESSSSLGINRSHATWTVQVAQSDGYRHVHTAKIARAWLVGTADN